MKYLTQEKLAVFGSAGAIGSNLVRTIAGLGARSVVVLDDLWLPSVRCALRYLEANRADWRRLPSPARDACVLEKIGLDRRAWDHFVRFHG